MKMIGERPSAGLSAPLPDSNRSLTRAGFNGPEVDDAETADRPRPRTPGPRPDRLGARRTRRPPARHHRRAAHGRGSPRRTAGRTARDDRGRGAPPAADRAGAPGAVGAGVRL